MDRAKSVGSLSHLYGSLVDLARDLSLTATELAAVETARTLSLDSEIHASLLTGLSLAVVQRVIECCGTAFNLSFSSEYGIRPFATKVEQLDAGAFERFKEDVAAAPAAATVRLRLSVDKNVLIQEKVPALAHGNIVVYIFLVNLVQALSGEFPEIEAIFFPDIYSTCMCFLLELDTALIGSHLTIMGPDSLNDFLKRKPRTSRRERIDRTRCIRGDNVSWIDFETRLTPYHLMLPPTKGAPGELTATLGAALYALVIIHLADSVRLQTGAYVATFAGLRQTQIYIPAKRQQVPECPEMLLRLFLWAYSDGGADKLPFARSVTTTYLSEDRAANIEVLAESAQRIWDSTRANYATYVRRFVTRHFDKLKEVDDYVRQTGYRMGEQISGLVGNLTTNMLATVGVIVGGFLAYALDKKTTPSLLSVGLKIYGAYIAIFPLGYFLIFHSLADYLITTSDFKRRMGDFELNLHLPGLSKKASDLVKFRRIHFWAALAISCAIYVCLALLCFRYSLHFRFRP